jgi:polyribonucleotide nucleotidyltransferase
MRILDIMEETLPVPRDELKPSAPKIYNMQINPEKIGALIGPGGKNIKRIIEVSGAQIDIDENDSGKVVVFAQNQDSLECAVREIEALCCEIETGKVYRGKVTSIRDFGVFVECLPGKEGLVHVSEMADFKVDDPSDICKVGDEIIVKCVGFDEKGRSRLSRRAVLCEARGMPYEPSVPTSSHFSRCGAMHANVRAHTQGSHRSGSNFGGHSGRSRLA